MNKYEMMYNAELDFDLAQKRTAAYKTKSILLDFQKVIAETEKLREYMGMGNKMFEKFCRGYVSFYLKLHSQYRHMWE